MSPMMNQNSQPHRQAPCASPSRMPLRMPSTQDAFSASRCHSGCPHDATQDAFSDSGYHSGCPQHATQDAFSDSGRHSGCPQDATQDAVSDSGCHSGCPQDANQDAGSDSIICHKMPLMMLVQTQDAPHGAPRDATHDASRCASVCDSQRFLQTCLGCDPWCSMRLRILLGCVSKCACGLLFCANCMQALSDHGRQAACDATANSVLLLLVPWVQAHQTPPSDARPHCKHLDTHGNHRSAWRQTWLAGANLRKVKLRETGALCSSKPKEREESNRPRAT